MSKTLESISSLLGTSSNKLFDRYINFTLRKNALTTSSDDLKFITPSSGLKPKITVSGTLNPQDIVNNITLTITNISETIDYNSYGWVEIEAGYKGNGASIKFMGLIINCYMSKPNPNGELVITCATSNVTDVYQPNNIVVHFTKDSENIIELINSCVSAINTTTKASIEPEINVPENWLKQTFEVNKGTYTFKSGMDCIAWLNSLFLSHKFNATYASNYALSVKSAATKDATSDKLVPILLRFDITDARKLICSSPYAKGTKPVVKALSVIGSAYLSGEYATVTAPFVPDIKPGETIYINSKYFRTRVNLSASDEGFSNMMKRLGNLWIVISMQFTFSTSTTNTMTLKLTNINNSKVGESY